MSGAPKVEQIGSAGRSRLDEPDVAADGHEQLSDVNERLADEREALADDREALADRHERELDYQQERQAHVEPADDEEER